MKKLALLAALALFPSLALAQSVQTWSPSQGYVFIDGGANLPSPLIPTLGAGGDYINNQSAHHQRAMIGTSPSAFNFATTFGAGPSAAYPAVITTTGTDSAALIKLAMNPDGGASTSAQSLLFQVWLASPYSSTSFTPQCYFAGPAGGAPGASGYYAVGMDGGAAYGVFNSVTFTPAAGAAVVYSWECLTDGTGSIY